MILIRFIYTTLITQQFCVAGKKLPLELLFSQTTTYYNPDYMSYFNISIKPGTPGPLMDVNMHFRRKFTIAESPMTNLTLLKKEPNGLNRSLISVTFNYCEFFGPATKQSTVVNDNMKHMIKLILDNVRKYSDWPACPILAEAYIIKSMRIDKKIIPAFIVPGKYRLEIANYITNKTTEFIIRNTTIHLLIKKIKDQE